MCACVCVYSSIFLDYDKVGEDHLTLGYEMSSGIGQRPGLIEFYK